MILINIDYYPQGLLLAQFIALNIPVLGWTGRNKGGGFLLFAALKLHACDLCTCEIGRAHV